MSTTITETRFPDIELKSLPATQAHSESLHDTNTDSQDADGYPKGLRLACITVALTLSIFLSALDSTIISTLIPEITNAFGSLNQVGWYGSAYAMTNASFLSLWGKAYTYFELKRTFVFCVVIFEAGNLLCGFATGSPMLIAGRALAGVGGAGNMTGCFIIIAYAVKPERRAVFMGTLGVTFAVASVTGPLLGGAFVDKLSCRWGFWINVPFALVATTMMTLSFKTPRNITPKPGTLREKALHMDIGGVAILLTATACFIFSMHYLSMPSQGKTNITAILFLTGFIVLSTLFIILEHRMETKAMIRLDLLTRRQFLGNCVFVFFLAGLYFPLLFSLPIRFQSVDDESASASGLRLIPLVCGISLFTMVSNYIISRRPRHTTLLIAGGILGILGASLISSTNKSATTSTWIAFELVVAAGIGIALQIPLIANQAAVAVDDIPTATSTTLFFETVGQALFVAAGEAAFVSRLIRNLRGSNHHIDVDLVVKSGATGFRKILPAEQIPFILESYVDALRVTYLMSLGCAIAAAGVAFWMIVPLFKERLTRGRSSGGRDR